MSREVLEPLELGMSQNRRYRVNVVHEDFGGDKWNGGNKQGRSVTKGYEEPDLSGEGNDKEDPDAAKIVENVFGGYKLTFHVPRLFHGGLFGKNGSTKRRIEEETRSEIYIPFRRVKSSNVTIKAKERSQVCAALVQIRSLVDSLRKRKRPTHFLAVPLNFGEMQNRLLELKASILEAQFPGIDKDLFIRGCCIHLTLGSYVLLDGIEFKKALEELEYCRSILADLTTPFEIKVKGLDIMHDHPGSARVLYGCIEAPELQKFADRVLAHFQSTGLSVSGKHNGQSIKLHMTVLKNCPKSFVAREILNRFGDIDFGSAQCSTVHLCELRKSGIDSFYKIIGSLEF